MKNKQKYKCKFWLISLVGLEFTVLFWGGEGAGQRGHELAMILLPLNMDTPDMHSKVYFQKM